MNSSTIKPETSVDVKVVKKNKRKERLERIRKEKHASVVQALWRGALHRKSMKKLVQATETIVSQIREVKLNRASHRIKDYGKIEVSKIDTIMCMIDYGLNLPLNCTCTKATIAMYNSSRKRMTAFHNNDSNLNIPSKINELSSKSETPNYMHALKWKMKGDEELDPTTLFIIKIETMELPTLKPAVVGYAFINLFINDSEFSPRQPKDMNNSKLYLNSGFFELGIYYGTIPKHSSLDIELIEKGEMKRIPDACLYVRIMDPTCKAHENCDKSNNQIPMQYKSNNENQSLSTLTKLTKAFAESTVSVEPPLPTELKMHYTKNNQSKGNQVDLDIYTEKLENWINAVYRISSVNRPINISTMLKYNDEHGLYCALDSLYNMPKLNKATSSKEKKTIIHTYKATFSYLSGKGRNEDDENWVQDDCTSGLEFDSTENCPIFNGEMFHVNKFGLTDNACILLVVTSINIITDDSKVDKDVQKNQANTPAGVKGLEILYNDPTATWYGLLKIRRDDNNNDKDSFFVDCGSHQVPLVRGIPLDAVLESKNPYNTFLSIVQERTKFQKLKYEEMKKKSTSCCCNGAVAPEFDEDPTIPKMISKDGASAFIRIVDGRLKHHHDKHIFKDNSISLKKSCLQKFTKASSCDKDGKDTDIKHSQIIEELFRYDALRYDDARRLKDAIPKNTDQDELMKFINLEYRKHVENS